MKTSLLEKLKIRARGLYRDTYALYFAARDPRVPWYAKAFMGLVVAYTFSPIDLIPDFIPVLGYLDELIIVPLGITLAIKMIPAEVMADSRAKADMQQGKPVSRAGAVIIISIWIIIIAVIVWSIVRAVQKS